MSVELSNGDITIKGYIAYSDIEGGCTYLVGDNGEKYELIYKGDLPPIGTYVVVTAKIKYDIMSVYMIGKVLDVKSIIKFN